MYPMNHWGEGIERKCKTCQCDHNSLSDLRIAHLVSLTRETDEDETFCSEGHDVPHGQEAGHYSQVKECLTPSVSIVDVTTPGQENAQQEGSVTGGKSSEINVTGCPFQVCTDEN